MKRNLPVMAIFLVLLAACSSLDRDDTYVQTKERDSRYDNGGIFSEKGGLSLFGGDKTVKNTPGLGVNAYLWRAALDTLVFMPMLSADPFGGTLITDWYAPTANERVKLNVYILSRELRADAVRVAVFRQQKTASGEWQDVAPNAATAGTLEDAILTRARQLRVKQLATQR